MTALIIALMLFAVSGWGLAIGLLVKLRDSQQKLAAVEKRYQQTLYLACQDRC